VDGEDVLAEVECAEGGGDVVVGVEDGIAVGVGGGGGGVEGECGGGGSVETCGGEFGAVEPRDEAVVAADLEDEPVSGDGESHLGFSEGEGEAEVAGLVAGVGGAVDGTCEHDVAGGDWVDAGRGGVGSGEGRGVPAEAEERLEVDGTGGETVVVADSAEGAGGIGEP
jgi:hypothetical protein